MAKSYQEKMQEDWTREHTRADKQRQKPIGTIAKAMKRAPARSTEAAKSLAKSQRQNKADTMQRTAYEIFRNRGESAVRNAMSQSARDSRSIIRDAIVNGKKNKGMGKTSHKK